MELRLKSTLWRARIKSASTQRDLSSQPSRRQTLLGETRDFFRKQPGVVAWNETRVTQSWSTHAALTSSLAIHRLTSSFIKWSQIQAKSFTWRKAVRTTSSKCFLSRCFYQWGTKTKSRYRCLVEESRVFQSLAMRPWEKLVKGTRFRLQMIKMSKWRRYRVAFGTYLEFLKASTELSSRNLIIGDSRRQTTWFQPLQSEKLISHLDTLLVY